MCIPSASDLIRGLAGAWFRLDIAIDQKLENGGKAVERLTERLSPRAFLESVYNRQIYVEQLFSKITQDMGHKSQISRLRLEKLMCEIDAVAPVAALSRGYSLVYGKYGLKTSARELIAGEEVVMQFHDGRVRATVDRMGTRI
jgi:exonuclease VII large subunit